MTSAAACIGTVGQASGEPRCADNSIDSTGADGACALEGLVPAMAMRSSLRKGRNIVEN